MKSQTLDALKFCGRCGAPTAAEPPTAVRCTGCGGRFFANAGAAAGVLLVRDGRVLFIERGREPSRGKLGLPGGFLDPGESAEAAAVREVSEEVGLTLDTGALDYVATVPNLYPFDGVTYHTLDVYFAAAMPADAEPRVDGNEATGVAWLDPTAFDAERLAFPAAAVARRTLVAKGLDARGR